MKVAVLQANLGDFDNPVDPVGQSVPFTFQRWTDENFPPITGLTPRFQYRIPKLFGWQMLPGYDVYIWLDGSMTLPREDSVQWLLDRLGEADMAVFKHPWRNSIQEECDHIEEYLQKGDKYLTPRYANGLHKEQMEDIRLDKTYTDDHLYASTVFIYRDREATRDAMRLWWLHQSRYYTCDQLAFTYALKDLDVWVIQEDLFKSQYISLASKH